MANIDAQAGLARARRSSSNVPGMCLAFVYASYGSVQSIGSHAGQYPIALNGWRYATKKHAGDRNPPVGVPVYFGASPTRTDRNKNAGDVAISMGGGLLWVTDVAGATGRTGIMTIAARERQTARPYLGWTGDFLGHNLVNIGKASGVVTVGVSQKIKDHQTYLNDTFGAGLKVDGRFGPKTKAATAKYQREVLHVDDDGLWGPITEAAHVADVAKRAAVAAAAAKAKAAAAAGKKSTVILRRGSKGSAVKKLQKMLNRRYPLYSQLKEDGDYGPATEAVVFEFQRRAGLTRDGIAGPQVLGYLGL
jgi:peptidoglycan hydrolase-like protein with peptidoglycan-binding domain